jgi:mono/diheme cytochrome c family protein
MEQVYQAKPLSMGWCLDCHRDPGPHLRPKDQVTNMNWVPPQDPSQLARALLEGYRIHDTAYMTRCSTCHR